MLFNQISHNSFQTLPVANVIQHANLHLTGLSMNIEQELVGSLANGKISDGFFEYLMSDHEVCEQVMYNIKDRSFINNVIEKLIPTAAIKMKKGESRISRPMILEAVKTYIRTVGLVVGGNTTESSDVDDKSTDTFIVGSTQMKSELSAFCISIILSTALNPFDIELNGADISTYFIVRESICDVNDFYRAYRLKRTRLECGFVDLNNKKTQVPDYFTRAALIEHTFVYCTNLVGRLMVDELSLDSFKLFLYSLGAYIKTSHLGIEIPLSMDSELLTAFKQSEAVSRLVEDAAIVSCACRESNGAWRATALLAPYSVDRIAAELLRSTRENDIIAFRSFHDIVKHITVERSIYRNYCRFVILKKNVSVETDNVLVAAKTATFSGYSLQHPVNRLTKMMNSIFKNDDISSSLYVKQYASDLAEISIHSDTSDPKMPVLAFNLTEVDYFALAANQGFVKLVAYGNDEPAKQVVKAEFSCVVNPSQLDIQIPSDRISLEHVGNCVVDMDVAAALTTERRGTPYTSKINLSNIIDGKKWVSDSHNQQMVSSKATKFLLNRNFTARISVTNPLQEDSVASLTANVDIKNMLGISDGVEIAVFEHPVVRSRVVDVLDMVAQHGTYPTTINANASALMEATLAKLVFFEVLKPLLESDLGRTLWTTLMDNVAIQSDAKTVYGKAAWFNVELRYAIAVAVVRILLAFIIGQSIVSNHAAMKVLTSPAIIEYAYDAFGRRELLM